MGIGGKCAGDGHAEARRGRRRRGGEEEAALPRWGASGLAWGKLQRAAAVQGLGGSGVDAPGYSFGGLGGEDVEDEGEKGGGRGGFAALGRQRAGLGEICSGLQQSKGLGQGMRFGEGGVGERESCCGLKFALRWGEAF
jgi:hypothetical protein